MAAVPLFRDSNSDVELKSGCQAGVGPSLVCCALCFWNPIYWPTCIAKVDTNEQKAVLYWGKYIGTAKEPGLYCMNPCGRELRSTSTRFRNLQLNDVKVMDQKGSPVVISAVVTFCFTSARKACLDVEQPETYLRFQARATMKEVVSRYPYSSTNGHSLQSSAREIGQEAINLLQQKVDIAGAQIHSFEFVDMSYAAEVAQVMLVRQQAEALVDARRIVVGAAVDMTAQAIRELESKGVKTSDEGKERIAGNLLSVICSHNPVTPTVPLS